MAMTLQEMLDLLPDNVTGEIDAADLRAIVTDLYGAANTYAQTFGYLYVTGAAPASGKVAINPDWVVGDALLAISETTEDGHNLVFTLLDSAPSRLILSGLSGGILQGEITGPSVDQGSYREIPVTVTSVTGSEPAASEKVAVTVLAMIP